MITEMLRASGNCVAQQYNSCKELAEIAKNILIYNGSLIAPPKHDSKGRLILEDSAMEEARQISLSLIREPRVGERKTLDDRGWTFVSSQIKSFCLIPCGNIVDFSSFIVSNGWLRDNVASSMTVAINKNQAIKPKGFWNLNYSQWLALEKLRTFLEKELHGQQNSMVPALFYVSGNYNLLRERIIPSEFSIRCPSEAYFCQVGSKVNFSSRIFPRGFEYDIKRDNNTDVLAYPAIVFKNALITQKK